jgi:hypothetical protein
VKSDAAFIRAVERAHVIERHVAATLRAHGLEALTQSTGTRADHSGIAAYAHDIDLDVAGYRCQYKHRTCALANLLTTVGHPIVDERIKADRTPVDFYILRFEDTALVVPYAPKSWRTILRFDYVDDSHKTYYVVSPDACIPYVMWVQWLIYHQNQQPTSTETLP